MEISKMTDAQVNQEARDLTSKLVNGGRKDEARELLKKYDASTVTYLYTNYPSDLRRYLADLRALPIVAPPVFKPTLLTTRNLEENILRKTYSTPGGFLSVELEDLEVRLAVKTAPVDVKIITRHKSEDAALKYFILIDGNYIKKFTP